MSCDNGIFILDHPRGYAVVDTTMSYMPEGIARIFHDKKDYRGFPLYIFSGNAAYTDASRQANKMMFEYRKDQEVLEYGIVDWRNPERDYKPELHGCRHV